MSTDVFKKTSIAISSEPSDAHVRRGVGWRAVTFVALVAAGAGLFAGTRVSGSNATSPGTTTNPRASMPKMAQHQSRPEGAGSGAVYISTARQQLIGVRTAKIESQRVEGTVRTVGMLSYDETHTTQIHTRVAGWVEQLYVDYVGKPVRRGQPLFAIYSPDLATAQADYLVALRSKQNTTAAASSYMRADGDSLLKASRERLRRWTVTDAQIEELERTGRPTRTVTVASPFDGVVLEKQAFAGQYVTPDMTSFKIADLSTVWAVGQVFEYEAARLHVGDVVDVEFPYGQAANRTGKIEFIYPEVDPQTRRVRFRVSLDNRDRKLKPDTYVNLVWHGEGSDRLVVPKEAVIDTGARKYVLLALAGGYFEPRDVQIGPAVGQFYPIAGGVREGERVVTSAQFLVDSETNLMAAMQAMAMSMPGMDMGMDTGGADMSGGSDNAGRSGSASMPGMNNMPAMNQGSGSAHDTMPGTQHDMKGM